MLYGNDSNNNNISADPAEYLMDLRTHLEDDSLIPDDPNPQSLYDIL